MKFTKNATTLYENVRLLFPGAPGPMMILLVAMGIQTKNDYVVSTTSTRYSYKVMIMTYFNIATAALQ